MQATKKILLAVSGMSPQIITETLYSLIQEEWIPDEVHLITTAQGRQNAVLQLLQGERHFQRLLDDYQVTHPVAFSEDSIVVIRDREGRELDDLRTPQDNEAGADTICRVIRELTNNTDTELHVSLAGGRKTMGFYAGYALSLFGRHHDGLSHVLVSEYYESNPDFFYPTPYTRVIRTRDGKVLDAAAARVWLARIPFVRLRNRLPDALLNGTHSFSEAVRLAREATEDVHLSLYPKECRYSINGKQGRLSPLHMGLLLWMAVRRQHGRAPFEPVVEGEVRSPKEFLAIAHKHWLNPHAKTEELLQREGITQSWLEQNLSRLNRELARTVGPELAERCKVASRSFGRYRGYALPADLVIHLETSEGDPAFVSEHFLGAEHNGNQRGN